MQFRYFYGSQADQFSFIRIPKLLLVDPTFAPLSIPAKLLYAVLLDRMSLSSKNGWFDEDNRVYIIYPTAEAQEDLGIGKKKALEVMSELVEFGLLDNYSTVDKVNSIKNLLVYNRAVYFFMLLSSLLSRISELTLNSFIMYYYVVVPALIIVFDRFLFFGRLKKLDSQDEFPYTFMRVRTCIYVFLFSAGGVIGASGNSGFSLLSEDDLSARSSVIVSISACRSSSL